MLYDGVAPERELLTLPGARGNLDIAEGDIRLVLAGNLPDFSPTPVLESVVTLHQPRAGLELDFTLHRGRVLIENHKENGSVKVRARIQGKNLDFELIDKKAVVALELFSHWPLGAPFSKTPKAEQKPIGELIFFVIQGEANLDKNKQKELLEGPVLYHFDSGQGVKGPLRLKQVPEWVNPAEQQPLRIQRLQTAIETLRPRLRNRVQPPRSSKRSRARTLRSASSPRIRVLLWIGRLVGSKRWTTRKPRRCALPVQRRYATTSVVAVRKTWVSTRL